LLFAFHFSLLSFVFTLALLTMEVPDTFNAADHFVDRHIRDGRGGHVAIECGDARVTYTQLADRTARCGEALGARFGVRREERVLLWLLDGPAFFYAFWGAIRMGAVPVPVNTMWTAQDLAYVLHDCRARVAIVSAALLPTLLSIPEAARRGLDHILVTDGAGEPGCHDLQEVIASAAWHVPSEGTAVPPANTSRDDPAFWLYSSGSTGPPKGCVHLQHDMLVCASTYARHVLGITERDRCFSVAKLFFAYGLGNAGYFPLSAGATAILWPGPPSAANVYAVIERYRPTLFFSVPTNYGMLLAHHPPEDRGEFDLSSIRLAVSAGEALPPALFDRFRRRFGLEILDGIGSTEVLQMFISNVPGRIRPGSSGQIVPGYEARIVDDEGRVVPVGEVGNLLIKGDSTCAYYWNQHEKTKATIEGHWIRTGDKYSCDADGYYWHAGRSDDMLKVGGIWVSPVELENVLIEHPAVRECAVVGHLDHDRLVKPAAFIVPVAGTEPTPALEQDLQQFARARLAEYKRPRWIRFLPELPKTATGKTQRFKLRSGGV
jgi:benzoate-CoA ligase